MFGGIGQRAQSIQNWLANAWRCFLSACCGDLAVDEFAQKVRQACQLLDFMITEGHPYHITDQIIDDLEASRQLVIGNTAPTPADRAKFDKAYRDLVNISTMAVTIDGVPPARFWSCRSPWPWSLLAFSVVPSLIVYFVCTGSPHWSLAYFVVSVLAIVTFYAFTGIASDHKLNQIIKLSYLFTVLALAGSLLPWAVPSLFGNGWTSDPTKVPLGVLRGCLVVAADEKATVPKAVLCRDKPTDGETYQWVVNIGGIPTPSQTPAQTTTATDARPGNIATPGNAASPGSAATTAKEVIKYDIRGGIVVPLYVIVLALFGSAISMTRRVPEYQRRAMGTQDAMSNEEAREDLVFQVMQVLSAPLIAIAAYYIVKPDNATISVLLGFGSGFSSEPILLMIRGLVDKLTPAQAATPSPISVRVDPATATLKAGQTQQFTAKVTGSANSEVSWAIVPLDGTAGTISPSGLYIAPRTITAAATATVTACSAADRTKCGSATITLQP